jgi:aminomethyltransferase
MEETILRQTPLFNQHINLGARIAPFGGWNMPIQYEGIIAEHNWTRQSASLFDICHMGEFLISASPDKLKDEIIFTFNLASMPLGACKYGFMLNEHAGIIDDLIAYRTSADRWMIVVNAATRNRDFAHISSHLPEGVLIEDISDKTAKLDLQGPFSLDVLVPMAGEGVKGLKYYQSGGFKLIDKDVIVSRTGYTGELGFEIYIDAGCIDELWERMLNDKRVKPAGLGARDTLRIEAGYPLYGQDIDENTTPLEAGFSYALDFNKDFIGKSALLKQKEQGMEKKLIFFISDTRRSPRHLDKIYADEKDIGMVTSGSFSPSLGFGIGMGYVENGYDWIGAGIVLKNEKSELSARITDKPFYRKGTVRK